MTKRYDFTTEATNFTIARVKVEKPTAGNVTRNDKVWTYMPEGYDETLQSIEGNVVDRKGTYQATVSLKDKQNYEWTDGTQEDIVFDWTAGTINKTLNILVASIGGVAGLLILALIIGIIIAAKRRSAANESSESVEKDTKSEKKTEQQTE